jgi:hypothetical protein
VDRIGAASHTVVAVAWLSAVACLCRQPAPQAISFYAMMPDEKVKKAFEAFYESEHK